MNDLNDKELIQVRLRFLDLIKSFFVLQPDSERLSRWRGTFSALVKDPVTPEIDKAARELNSFLSTRKLEEIQDEYYSLFTDPFSESHVNLMASYHLDGRNYGDTLIKFRSFLKDTEITVDNSLSDSEDSLTVLLDVLLTLIELEKEGKETIENQKLLLDDFLLPAIERLADTINENRTADFYRSCIHFCKGYLNLEKSLAT